ncbi:MAG TPA: tetratricopeptide repeat protein, partial [Nitrospirales bacterium]|nr:tetratricopeptide repeat protein [Nitrospirales bacterium]
ILTIASTGPSTLMAEQKDFLSIQQFASAEIARVGLCDDPNLDRAVEGYQNALNIGFQNVLYEAEAHHRTGLAYRDQEKFPQAIAAMQKSLEVRPAIAEVHHHLGTVYERMPDAERAIEAYLTAVRLRPNYLVARFHLAAAYVEVDPKRSIREFETYVALAEDRQREQDRLQRAKEHLLRLKQN